MRDRVTPSVQSAFDQAVAALLEQLNKECNGERAGAALLSLLTDDKEPADPLALAARYHEYRQLQSVVESWLGAHEDPQQQTRDLLHSLFGLARLDQFSRQLGVSRERTVCLLAELLPKLFAVHREGGGNGFPPTCSISGEFVADATARI